MPIDTDFSVPHVEATTAPRAQIEKSQHLAPNPGPNTATTGTPLPLTGESLQQSAHAPIEQLVQELNVHAQNLNRNLRFSIDEATGRTVIHVIDGETGESIRQIPAEVILAAARNIDGHIGLLFGAEA